MTIEKMLKMYGETTATENYIFGFYYKGKVYVTFNNSNVLEFIASADIASKKNGGGMVVRFRKNNKKASFLIENASKYFVLCSEKHFKDVHKSVKYNRGETFEMLMFEHYGMEYHKDNTKYSVDGDIHINGIAYQMKFDRATITSVNSLGLK